MKKIVLGENFEIDNVEPVKEDVKKENINEKCKASFSKSNGDMVSLKKDSNEIKLRYISSRNININPQLNEDNRIAIYKNVEDGIDLKYELEDKRLKESFIINERKENYSFNFEAKIRDLVPNYNDSNKCLELSSNGKVIYRMLPPFMFDNKGEESKKCTYEIENNEDGILSIKLIADPEWINNEERELPVIIDPTFEFGITDNQFNIQSSGAVSSLGDENEVFLGYKNVDGDFKFYSFDINVDLSELESNNEEDKIYFEMPVNYNIMDDTDEIVVISNGIESCVYKPSQLISNGLFKIDVSKSFKGTSSGTLSFKIASDAVLGRSGSPYYKSKTFKEGVYKASFQIRDASGKQRAKLVFQPKKESNEFVDYDIGSSGVTSVNIQTKSFKHTIKDCSIFSGPLCLDIYHVFNSKDNSNSPYGQFWNISFPKLFKKENGDSNRKITYVDSNDVEHIFYERWFYKIGSKKYYINSDDVTISEDNKPSTRDGQLVEYEIINEEGYEYFSLSSATNYDAKKKEYHYFVEYDGFKLPVIKGSNFLQFVYYDDADSSYYYIECKNVRLTNNGFITTINGRDRHVFLDDVPTKVDFNKCEAIIKNLNGNELKVKIQKVPVYENLDNGLYTSSELESLEYSKNKANSDLKELENIINRKKEKELSLLKRMECIDFDLSNDLYTTDEKSFNKSMALNKKINRHMNLYGEFVQLETGFISAYNQIVSAELNSYMLTRNFNSKLKEQKSGVNDYVVDPDGNIVLFDGYGRFVGVMNKHDNKIEIVYDEDSKIEKIKSNDEQISFTYAENKKLESIKKSNGDVVRFTYTFGDMLVEIAKNGRKTVFTYLNGLQVFADNNDEIIVDTATDKTIKIKKYVQPGFIDETTSFVPFLDRKLIQNDMYVYKYKFNTSTTEITNRITNKTIVLDFDNSGKVEKQEDSETVYYANYYNEKLLSSIKAKKNPSVLASVQSFSISDNKYSYVNSESKKYISKSNMYCLMVLLLPLNKDFKTITLSVSYEKSGQAYNFKQTYIGKDYEHIVLPFYLMGTITNLKATVEGNAGSLEDIQDYIQDISIFEVENGVLNEYDENDRLYKVKDNDGKTTYLEFDRNLPTRVEFKDWNGKVLTTDYQYNDEGKLIYSIDSKGNCKNYLYQDGGNSIETKEYNIKDASLVRTKVVVFDEKTKTYIEKGNIKDINGNFPERKNVLYPGTDIVKTSIDYDGNKTEFNIDHRTKKLIGLVKENNGVCNFVSYSYNCDYLTSVKNNGTEVKYSYDGLKRLKTVTIKGYSQTILSNMYQDNTTVYGKDNKSYLHGSIITSTINGSVTITSTLSKENKLLKLVQKDSINTYSTYYSYNEDNLISKIETTKTGENSYVKETDYTYDVGDRATSCIKVTKENDQIVEKTEQTFQYNSLGILISSSLTIDDLSPLTNSYYYDADNVLIRETVNGAIQINYEHDALNRTKHQELKFENNFKLCHEYAYLQQDGSTLDIIAEENVKVVTADNSYSFENKHYSYDVCGRITQVLIDDKKINYEYDDSGRLITEYNEILNIENKYTYDRLSNITSKKSYDISSKALINKDELVYACDGKRQLVSLNGSLVTHDGYGRMISYKDKSFVWNKDGALKSISSNSNVVGEYSYNDKGIRTKKTLSNGDSIRFILDGDRILQEKHNTFSINFLYSLNNLFGFTYNNDTYIYERNIFGDIVRIYNTNGDIVGEYTYDAFGNGTIVTDVNGIASINPFRYRGYYYDVETGLYYLNARYYDPSLGRFISPDDVKYIDPNNVNGLNIYAYCINDPVNKVDPTGHFFISALLIGALVGGIIGAGASVISQGITNGWDNINGWQVLLDGTIGAASGLLSATGIGTVGAALISGGLGFVGSVGGDLISSNGDWSSINWAKAAIMGAVNVGLGAWAGAGSQNSAALGKGLLRNGDVNKTFGILYNATNNYLIGNISKRGFSGVFNLYGNQFINAVSKALPGTVARLTAINLGKLGIASIISGGASIGLNYLF